MHWCVLEVYFRAISEAAGTKLEPAVLHISLYLPCVSREIYMVPLPKQLLCLC